MRTNSMKVLLCKYFTPRVVILRVTNREREREKIYEVQRGVVGFPKKRTRREKEEEGKGTRALKLLFKLQAVCECARVYDVCNTPSSYRQPSGNGQFFSRRYCTHSVWLFSCASSTAR
jgi:hypothetical protein